MGKADTPEYKAWAAMRLRCFSPDDVSYRNYGGRGISVCPEWATSFASFYLDMGPRPSSKHTLERRENDKGYNKGNCVWATRAHQNRNYRRNVFLVFQGISMVKKDWARFLCVTYQALDYQLSKKKDFAEVVDHFINRKHARD